MRPYLVILLIMTCIVSIYPIVSAHAELWDLIIIADVEKAVILSGQSPVIIGQIVDHASKPVGDVKVHIRTGQESVFTFTDNEGKFRVSLYDMDRIPGTYIVSIVGKTSDGKIGIVKTEFQVKGEISKVSLLEKKISTAEAKRYLTSNEEKFAKDPIGQTLFKYYKKLQQEYLEEKEKVSIIETERHLFEQQKRTSDELRLAAIKEFKPSYGSFSGYKYDDYVRNLNPEIRDEILSQINFTKNLFEEGRLIREEILKNGGTTDEARQAYLEKIATTQEFLSRLSSENTEQFENSTDMTVENSQNTDNYEAENIKEIELTETDIDVKLDGNIVFVNINGTSIKFLVNGTGVYQIENIRNQTHE